MTRALTLSVMVTTALLLSACGPQSEIEDNSTPAPTAQEGAQGSGQGRIDDLAAATTTPPDAERGVTGRLKVEVPQGWQERRVDDAFDLRYLAGEGERDPLLSLSGNYGSFHGARAAVSTLIAQIQMGTPGFTIHSQEDIEIPGASSGIRVDFSFGKEEDEDGVFDAMWIVGVDSTNGNTVAVAYSGGDDEVDDRDLDRIAESVQMLPAQQ